MLEFNNRSLTINGNGSTFKSLNAPSGHRALWRAWTSNVTFRNMTLVGSYAHGGTLTDSRQWAHGIDLRGSHGRNSYPGGSQEASITNSTC